MAIHPFIMSKLPQKPAWLKVTLPTSDRCQRTRRIIEQYGLATVCTSARCPNIGECWGCGTATFMILGDICTRGCGFCAVARGGSGTCVDKDEAIRVARAVRQMKLDYAVITSVTRDDLPDGGASVFARTIEEVRALCNARVEVLIPDFTGPSLKTILAAAPAVLAHNLEVVNRLSRTMRHSRFSYERSLEVLAEARRLNERVVTKSSLMLGLGETDAEIRQAMTDLRAVDVDLLVLGQYLQPTRAHVPVVSYVPPRTFAQLAAQGYDMGFSYVAAAPLARTSYKALYAYQQVSRK